MLNLFTKSNRTTFGISSLIFGLLIGVQLSSAATFGGGHFSGPTSSTIEGELSGTSADSDYEQTVYCPDTDAWHQHGYTNTSGYTEGYEYYMYVKYLRFYLHDDFVDSIDLSTMECSTPSGYVSCDGGTATDDGGLEVTIVRGDTSSDAVYPDYIQWEYGITDRGDRPFIPGYNDYDADGDVDTSDQEYRWFYETLDFDFDEDVVTGDSATTDSALYVSFYAYDQSCGDWSDSDCWQEVEEDGETGYHWNNHTTTLVTNYECEEVACDSLAITPSSLSVADVFNDTDLEVTATGTDGSDITGDSTFHYQAYEYDSSRASPDASGSFKRQGNDLEGGDSTVRYNNSLPGDAITVCVSDYNGVDYCGSGVCEVELEFPYCTDLDITSPGISLPAEGPYEANIRIDADADFDEGTDWPYSVTYESTDLNATFDGTTTPYTTTDWTVAYYSEEVGSNTVSVGLDDENGDGVSDDVANLCNDSFDYTITENDCIELHIVSPLVITADDMAGTVTVTWTGNTTTGILTPPFTVSTSDGVGSIYDPATGVTMTGTHTLVMGYSVEITGGTPGADITVTSNLYPTDPTCRDVIPSETPEEIAPVCEDLTLGTPYIIDSTGTEVPIDLTDAADLATLYGTNVVCWDYTLNVSDTTYLGTLEAAGYTDNTATAYTGTTLTLDAYDSTGTTLVDSDSNTNTADVSITGYTSYTGTLCFENYEEGNYITLGILTEEAACFADEELPPLEEEESYVCVDLEMDPDSYTMSATDADAGTITVTIDVTGSDALWTGNLIVEYTGSGDLYYTDGSASAYGDGHLEIPVSGTATTVTVTYVGGVAGDIVTSYIEDEDTLCNDVFTITQEGTSGGNYCIDVEMSPDSYVMSASDATAGTIAISTMVTASDAAWSGNLIIANTGSGDLYYSSGSASTESDGHLEVAVSGTSTTVTATYVGGVAGDTVTSYIEGEALICTDAFSITQGTTTVTPGDDDSSGDDDDDDTSGGGGGGSNVCLDVSFGEDSIDTVEGADESTEICVDTEDSSEDLDVSYYCGDTAGTILYDDDNNGTYDTATGDVTIEDVGNGDCVDIIFEDICEDAEISVDTQGEGKSCSDTLPVEIQELGTFSKFIFTFNFSLEKNSHSDENVFFAHDEDRAFYTLQYDPAGGEEDITFTDSMWDGTLEGKNGDGTSSGGDVELATNYSELTSATAYSRYSTLVNMGFGCPDITNEATCHELHNEEYIVPYVESFDTYFYKTFIPYLAYDDNTSESTLIDVCEYDPLSGDLTSTEVCYDPDYSPENPSPYNKVVIENAGTVVDIAVIRIRYVGIINSGLECSDGADECLTEEFQNDAELQVYDGIDSLTASARLVVLCSYLLTENAGDVYLEVALEGGSDISCIFVDEDEATSNYANTDALIILEGSSEETTSSSTYLSDPTGTTISLCDSDSSSTGLIGNLSSYVCEIVNTVTDLWRKTTVETTTESHVSQATRNTVTLQSSNVDSTSGNGSTASDNWSSLAGALSNSNNPDSNILYFNGCLGVSTCTTSAGKLTLGSLEVPAGAWTIIVENADLVIAGDISYATATDLSDYKNLPSVAFVVQGGDIYFKNTSYHNVGVYYTDQNFYGNSKDTDTNGDWRSPVDGVLTVDGSLYGNIQHLMDAARFVAPPTLEGGGLVIRYDSRILLNTPPSLSEYVDVSTEKAIN